MNRLNKAMNDLIRGAAGAPRTTEPLPPSGPGNIDAAAGRNQHPYRVQSANEAMNEAIRESVFRMGVRP